jgi:hypothetical protein
MRALLRLLRRAPAPAARRPAASVSDPRAAAGLRVAALVAAVCIWAVALLLSVPGWAPAATPAPASAAAPVGAPVEAPPPAARSQAAPVPGEDSAWPLTIRAADTTLTVYPFQLDAWDGDTLTGRAAVRAVVGKDKPTTSYGVVTASARALSDKGRRLVTLDRVTIEKLEFPAVPATEIARFRGLLATDFARRTRTIALDKLEAALEVASEAAQIRSAPLRNDPPDLVFSETPAILVSIDGEPAWRAVPETGLERALNTRALLLRDAQGRMYVHVFDGWLAASAATGPWSVAPESPDLARAYKDATAARLVDPLSGQSTPDQKAPSLKTRVPGLVVVTRPSELIVLNGPPNYVAIAGTQLQYADNTTGHVLRHTGDGQVYVLVSGRWFRAPSLQGPWAFVRADALPADFAAIPDDSPKENLKASVAGTAQAREAAIAARVPQTAIVKIAGTQMTPPKFDGAPALRPITGTTLRFAANTQTPIVATGDQDFFALENGVWFHARAVDGPWAIATAVPSEIYTIPPSSPLYFVTFARLFRVEGDNAYVGYTPGYQGTMVDPETGVVVYGTGFAYAPWIGTVWFGGPYTYGFGAAPSYTPWTGWAVAFGFGWAWGEETVVAGWGWGPYPWWGPWGWGWAWGPWYYPWYPWWGGVAYGPHGGAVVWGPGGWAGYSGNIYRNWGNRATVSRVTAGYNAWTGNAWAGRVGISYNSRTGIASAGQRAAVANVYTGNYAYGSRGVATGPNGGAVAGGRVTVGNAGTGNQVTASKGAVYNPNTGEITTFETVRGENGGVARVGDDVYAGRDGNVYRHTEGGWEQFTPGSGWSPVEGGRPGEGAGGGAGERPGAGGGAGIRPGEGAGPGAGAGAGAGPGAGAGAAPGAGTLPAGGGAAAGEGGHAAAAAVIGITAAGIAAGGSGNTTSRGAPPSVQQLDRDRQARTLGTQRAQGLQRSSVQMNRSFRGGGGFRGGRR